jgi:folate-dependent tRNA-U54 methylase TrmFO/GidA|tara:strand:- start:662 stop:943 length:282 start_codon:yes stop_codon:yes gene_type:complete
MSTVSEDILDFDFGFTAVDADELEVVRTATEKSEELSAQVESTSAKAELVYNAVIPLLNNLKANPEKDYIYWPNRHEKIDAFADKLYAIMNGS